jgi:hypothetical protein
VTAHTEEPALQRRPTTLRVAVGVAAGLLAWIVVATVGNLVLRAALKGYAEVEASMSFTLAMQLSRLVLGAVCSLAAGLVTAWVTKGGGAGAKVLAGVLLVVFLPIHYTLWDKFPPWYHIVFLASLVVMTILGAMGYSRYARGRGERVASNDGARPNSTA